MSEKGLKILAKESLISLSEDKILNPCDYCLLGEHHGVSFRKHLKRKENKLELIHYDVCVQLRWSRYMVIDILSPLLMMLHVRLGFTC